MEGYKPKLRKIAIETAKTIGLELIKPNPSWDLYDNINRMGFQSISEHFLKAVTYLGPMRDELTLMRTSLNPLGGSQDAALLPWRG